MLQNFVSQCLDDPPIKMMVKPKKDIFCGRSMIFAICLSSCVFLSMQLLVGGTVVKADCSIETNAVTGKVLGRNVISI